MVKITEFIVEPSKIFTGSTFKLKIKIKDDSTYKSILATEDGRRIATEDNRTIVAEWRE